MSYTDTLIVNQVLDSKNSLTFEDFVLLKEK